MEPSPPPVLNLTIVTYVLYPAVFLSSRPFIGPALDTGAERLRYLYNFNVTVQYIGSYNWSTVQGMVDNVYLVHQFFEKTWDRNGVVVLVTPGTEEVTGLGDLAREQDSLLFTTSLTIDGLQNRQRYPTMISTAPVQMQAYPEVLFAVMMEYSWSSVCVIRDKGALAPFYSQWIDAARNMLRGRFGSSKITFNVQYFNSSEFGTDGSSSDTFSGVLRQCTKISRVLVFSMRGDTAKRILVQASRMGMSNGEYVYFVMEPLMNARFFGGISSFGSWNVSDNGDILQGYRNLLRISPCQISDSPERKDPRLLQYLMEEWIRRSKTDYSFDYISGEQPNEFVTAVYEAVDVFGQILNRSLQENASMSGRALASHALNRSFAAELREVFIDMFGERKSLHCVADFDVNNNTFQNAMVYKTSEHRFSVFDKDEIDWSGSMGAPPNEPRCGYTGDRCDTSQQRIGATVAKILGATAGVLLAGPGFLVWALRDRIRKSDMESWWEVDMGSFRRLPLPSENLHCPFPIRRQSTVNSVRSLSHRFSENKSVSRRQHHKQTLFAHT